MYNLRDLLSYWISNTKFIMKGNYLQGFFRILMNVHNN